MFKIGIALIKGDTLVSESGEIINSSTQECGICCRIMLESEIIEFSCCRQKFVCAFCVTQIFEKNKENNKETTCPLCRGPEELMQINTSAKIRRFIIEEEINNNDDKCPSRPKKKKKHQMIDFQHLFPDI